MIKITGTETNKLKSINLSILFNIGYWHEVKKQLDEATKIYKQIIDLHPDYIDAYLRLASIAKSQGQIENAIEWIDKASMSKAKAPVNQLC